MKINHYNRCPRPNCCRAIKDNPIVYLVAQTCEGESETPYWAMTVSVPEPSVDNEYIYRVPKSITVTNCPFCARTLPAVLIGKNFPRKIKTITDGGYYCDTCNNRLDCNCFPAETKYEICLD